MGLWPRALWLWLLSVVGALVMLLLGLFKRYGRGQLRRIWTQTSLRQFLRRILLEAIGLREGLIHTFYMQRQVARLFHDEHQTLGTRSQGYKTATAGPARRCQAAGRETNWRPLPRGRCRSSGLGGDRSP